MDQATGFTLYFGAPFFAYPHKATLNAYRGSSYEVAYAHFRRDHSDPWNILFHVCCLVFQLVNNMGLLAEFDAMFGKKWPFISLLTITTWSVHLAIHAESAPKEVVACSVASLLAVFLLRKAIQRSWVGLMYVQAILEILAIQLFVINKVRDTTTGLTKEIPIDWQQFLGLLFVRISAQYFLVKGFFGEIRGNLRLLLNVAVLGFMTYACTDPWGKVPPFFLGLVGWFIAVITGQRWLFFYSSGFLATMAQGIAHYYSKQQPTMPNLHNTTNEIAHATFFPNLVFQTIHQSLSENGII